MKSTNKKIPILKNTKGSQYKIFRRCETICFWQKNHDAHLIYKNFRSLKNSEKLNSPPYEFFGAVGHKLWYSLYVFPNFRAWQMGFAVFLLFLACLILNFYDTRCLIPILLTISVKLQLSISGYWEQLGSSADDLRLFSCPAVCSQTWREE